MKRVIVLTEKPSMTTVIKRAIQSIGTDIYSSGTYMEYFSVIPYGFLRFEYSGGTEREFPTMEEPELKINNIYHKINGNPATVDGMKNLLQTFDEIIIAPDPDHTGAYGVFKALEMFLGNNWEDCFKEIHYIPLMSLEPKSIIEPLKASKENKEYKHNNVKRDGKTMFEGLYEKAKVKRYFDFNYNLNSAHSYKIITEIGDMRKKRSYEDDGISKYGIMLLHIINENNSKNNFMSEADILHYMQTYKVNEEKIGIASVVSRAPILEDLLELGLIIKNESKKIVLTAAGDAAANHLLHQATYDEELPYRIDKWMDRGYTKEVKMEIDEYLLNVFTKQNKLIDRIKN